MKEVVIYTDGACSGNPGPGGWGALLRYGGHQKEIYGGEANTTNNRMELMAAIEALRLLKDKRKVDIYTDSIYVKDGIGVWIEGWKKNGWKTSQKKPVKNADLWQLLDEVVNKHQMTWHWVRGHNGDPDNERADYLARLGIPKEHL